MKRWRVALETAMLVAGIVAIKVVVEILRLDFIALSPLYTSVVAGGIFVIGLLVAGTLADYKEAEKMPAEITAALENIHEDGVSIKQTYKDFDLVALQKRLAAVARTLLADLADNGSRRGLSAVNGLSQPFVEMEQMDVPANYIVRLRNEQGTIRKLLLRIYHIQRTDFLPSAYVLIQTIVALIIAALVFTRLDPIVASIVVLVFIAYFFIYLVRLLKILDTPFRPNVATMDDVSLFLLKEFLRQMEDETGPVE